MSRTIKVFGGNLDGVHRVVVACTSLAAFYRLTGVSRGYASETGNSEECATALAEPGVIFASKGMRMRDDTLRRIEVPPVAVDPLSYHSAVWVAVREAFAPKVAS